MQEGFNNDQFNSAVHIKAEVMAPGPLKSHLKSLDQTWHHFLIVKRCIIA